MTDLILAEKPSAGRAIANALGTPVRKNPIKGVAYYVIGKNIVCSAVGHLFNLYPKIVERGIYPKWESNWVPSWQIYPALSYLENYWKCLQYVIEHQTLEDEFDRFIIATDNDIEGTVIGFITFAILRVPTDKIFRMKMNSLAKDEVKNSYENIQPPDFEWFAAGFARHEVDLLFGVNLSEAFSKAISLKRERWKTLSLGRVQTPTLKFITERENEIKSFVSKKFWNVRLKITIDGVEYVATFNLPDVEKVYADKVTESCRGVEEALVKDVIHTETITPPPLCFSLSTLQQEAWYKLHYTPDFTDSIAQSLYTQVLISYPRTGSTSIMYVPTKKVLESLVASTDYGEFAKKIVENKWLPRKGGMYDGAHTAIYPTAETHVPSGKFKSYEPVLLDLIRRRFLATYYPPIKRKETQIVLLVGNYQFTLSGVVTLDKGWTVPYPFKKLVDIAVPSLNIADRVKIISIYSEEGETKPPSRHSFASIVREMEKCGIGTKATRSIIIKTLMKRRYVISERGSGIRPTFLGEELIEVATKYVPQIVDIKMTSELETDLNEIENNKRTKDEVVSKAKTQLAIILDTITKNIETIGSELLVAEQKEKGVR